VVKLRQDTPLKASGAVRHPLEPPSRAFIRFTEASSPVKTTPRAFARSSCPPVQFTEILLPSASRWPSAAPHQAGASPARHTFQGRPDHPVYGAAPRPARLLPFWASCAHGEKRFRCQGQRAPRLQDHPGHSDPLHPLSVCSKITPATPIPCPASPSPSSSRD
jgi:hypothetical protein